MCKEINAISDEINAINWCFYHSMCKFSGFHGKRHFIL